MEKVTYIIIGTIVLWFAEINSDTPDAVSRIWTPIGLGVLQFQPLLTWMGWAKLIIKYSQLFDIDAKLIVDVNNETIHWR